MHFVEYLADHYQKFGIMQSEFEYIRTVATAYQTAHGKASNPNAGRADRSDRSIKSVEVRKAVRSLVNSRLRYNSAVSDEERIILGLRVHDAKPTPVPKPNTYPRAVVRPIALRQLCVEWRNASSNSRAKPAGVHGCEIRYAVLGAPPTSLDELTRSEFATRSRHIFSFEESLRGKTVYFVLRWESNRGEKGPWSDILRAIIP